jgi:hypothetical protein
VIKAIHHGANDGDYTCLCGAASYEQTADRSRVTCKRCLASLANRDREFRAKARRGIGHLALEPRDAAYKRAWRVTNNTRIVAARLGLCRIGDAARAIAREEGRP